MDPPVHAARGPGPQQRGPSEGWGTLGHTHSEAGDRVTCASRPFGRSTKGLTSTAEVLTRSLKFTEQLLSSEEIKNKK